MSHNFTPALVWQNSQLYSLAQPTLLLQNFYLGRRRRPEISDGLIVSVTCGVCLLQFGGRGFFKFGGVLFLSAPKDFFTTAPL